MTQKTSTILAALTWISAITAFAGTEKKWDDVPEAVRKTVLANGGTDGQSVDLEGKKIKGLAVYEASVKDKKGTIADLVITADGKLVETKHDDAADKTGEREARAKEVIAHAKFSHPTEITNPYLPLSSLKQDILEGNEDGKKVRITRTAKPDKHKTFTIGGQTVETLVVEDSETEDGEIAEVAVDYFAQDDEGTVYYLGEEVDEYKNGKVVSHEGSWMFGKDTPVPGVIIPAHPKKGDKFQSEDVSDEISEVDKVVYTTESAKTPAGDFHDCVKVAEHLADGSTEYKYYAKGVGVVREQPEVGDVLLISHMTNQGAGK